MTYGAMAPTAQIHDQQLRLPWSLWLRDFHGPYGYVLANRKGYFA